MRIGWPRRGLCLSILVLCAACFGQKKADEWAISNAMIGPDSPIEVRAGNSYRAQAMYPVPDGPLFPLKATVTWSIAPPVKGISIDATSGKISVAADVKHGATTTVHAEVAGGQRKLTAKLYVFRPEENPLVGRLARRSKGRLWWSAGTKDGRCWSSFALHNGLEFSC
jgi:hypothetical protein